MVDSRWEQPGAAWYSSKMVCVVTLKVLMRAHEALFNQLILIHSGSSSNVKFNEYPPKYLTCLLGKGSVICVCMLLNSFRKNKWTDNCLMKNKALRQPHEGRLISRKLSVCPWITTSKYYLRNIPSKYCQQTPIDLFLVISIEWQEKHNKISRQHISLKGHLKWYHE